MENTPRMERLGAADEDLQRFFVWGQRDLHLGAVVLRPSRTLTPLIMSQPHSRQLLEHHRVFHTHDVSRITQVLP